MEQVESGLWRRLREDGDVSAREALLELHLPYAKIVAATYYGKRIHDEVEFADYLQMASLGLIEALDRFDPAFGVMFKTFAARRMHGTIIDGLQCANEKHQQIAAAQQLQAQRSASIRGAHSEKGSGTSPRRRTPEQALQFVAEVGIGFALAWLLDGTGMIQDQEREQAEVMPFYRSVELRQLRDRIVELVRGLPPNESKVIQFHYFQEVSFEDLSEAMNLSRGRISQIHRQGLIRLKESLRRHLAFDVSG
ncbi:MAG: sigma-70 family RNA polymerase sigma factor [Ramlibacter sp.]|nr:sigma-70 family RNA polymerase sigma factor [Ramlibacter sp.]